MKSPAELCTKIRPRRVSPEVSAEPLEKLSPRELLKLFDTKALIRDMNDLRSELWGSNSEIKDKNGE